jgi:uncharacterized protein YbcI
MLICVLEDSLTPAEKKLRAMGEYERLREARMFYQYAARADFVEPVERITGRRVRSFISGTDAKEDVSVETFVFYPEDDDGSSGRDGVGATPSGG